MKDFLKNLMEKINELIEKIGLDKVTHFAVAAWIVAECKAYGVGAACIGFITVIVLSFIKEKFMDKEFGMYDLWYSACGAFLSLLLMVIQENIV